MSLTALRAKSGGPETQVGFKSVGLFGDLPSNRAQEEGDRNMTLGFSTIAQGNQQRDR